MSKMKMLFKSHRRFFLAIGTGVLLSGCATIPSEQPPRLVLLVEKVSDRPQAGVSVSMNPIVLVAANLYNVAENSRQKTSENVRIHYLVTTSDPDQCARSGLEMPFNPDIADLVGGNLVEPAPGQSTRAPRAVVPVRNPDGTLRKADPQHPCFKHYVKLLQESRRIANARDPK